MSTITRPTPGQVEQRDRPTPPEQRTVDVNVEAVETRGRTVTGYAAVYNAESGDLGGFRERIAPGAFASVLDSDVRCLLNHDPNVVLGRTRSGTLRLHDEQRGLRFEVDLPESRSDIREAVQRGDIDGASFRFRVARDSWQGDMRTVEQVAELQDVTIATYGAYPEASVELRTRPEPGRQPDSPPVLMRRGSGSLRVEDRTADQRREPRGLADEFRAAGFPGRPGEAAVVPFERFEDRAVTWTGSVDNISPVARQAGPLGADQRYAWPAFPRVAVDAGDTSVDVMIQTARTLPAAASMIRAIDATTAKPEVGSTLTVSPLALKQVPAIQTGIPNVYLEQAAFNTVIEGDLRLALNEGLDKLVLDAIAASGFQAPGTDPLLVSIRKAITAITAAGYTPDTLILTPAAAEALDVLVSGVSGGNNDYVFAPAQFAPGTIFGLQRRVSKTAAAPVVADSAALGKLYASPIALARFEADAGTTNKSNVRLELNAAFGVERQNAVVRIAAS